MAVNKKSVSFLVILAAVFLAALVSYHFWNSDEVLALANEGALEKGKYIWIVLSNVSCLVFKLV